MTALGQLIYFLDQLQCFPARVGVDVNVIPIIVVIVDEIKIDCLITGNECLPMNFCLRERFSQTGVKDLIEGSHHAGQWPGRYQQDACQNV
jgi:hypothetical protein